MFTSSAFTNSVVIIKSNAKKNFLFTFQSKFLLYIQRDQQPKYRKKQGTMRIIRICLKYKIKINDVAALSDEPVGEWNLIPQWMHLPWPRTRSIGCGGGNEIEQYMIHRTTNWPCPRYFLPTEQDDRRGVSGGYLSWIKFRDRTAAGRSISV